MLSRSPGRARVGDRYVSPVVLALDPPLARSFAASWRDDPEDEGEDNRHGDKRRLAHLMIEGFVVGHREFPPTRLPQILATGERRGIRNKPVVRSAKSCKEQVPSRRLRDRQSHNSGSIRSPRVTRRRRPPSCRRLLLILDDAPVGPR